MGIAQRQIHIKFDRKQARKTNANPLPTSIKTMGDWIKVKRTDKNLTSGHVATKMGIAQSLVRSWEAGESRPDSQQLKVLEIIFGTALAPILAFTKTARIDGHESFQAAGKTKIGCLRALASTSSSQRTASGLGVWYWASLRGCQSHYAAKV